MGTFYDPMVAKIVARGEDRAAALRALRGALAGTQVAGLPTNLGFLRRLAAHPGFEGLELDTGGWAAGTCPFGPRAAGWRVKGRRVFPCLRPGSPALASRCRFASMLHPSPNASRPPPGFIERHRSELLAPEVAPPELAALAAVARCKLQVFFLGFGSDGGRETALGLLVSTLADHNEIIIARPPRPAHRRRSVQRQRARPWAAPQRLAPGRWRTPSACGCRTPGRW